MRRQPGARRRPSQLGDIYSRREYVGPENDPGAGLIPEWVNNYKASLYPFVASTTAQQVVPANPLRSYLLVQNKDGAADMFINFGQKPTTFNAVIIIPRGNYEFIGGANGGPFCPSDSVWILASAAAVNGVLVEGVLPPIVPGG
jgi:hypothetical protein